MCACTTVCMYFTNEFHQLIHVYIYICIYIYINIYTYVRLVYIGIDIITVWDVWEVGRDLIGNCLPRMVNIFTLSEPFWLKQISLPLQVSFCLLRCDNVCASLEHNLMVVYVI